MGASLRRSRPFSKSRARAETERIHSSADSTGLSTAVLLPAQFAISQTGLPPLQRADSTRCDKRARTLPSGSTIRRIPDGASSEKVRSRRCRDWPAEFRTRAPSICVRPSISRHLPIQVLRPSNIMHRCAANSCSAALAIGPSLRRRIRRLSRSCWRMAIGVPAQTQPSQALPRQR
jgi:hypothetical protein